MLNVTYGEPASRVPLFRKHGWRVEFYVLSKPQQPVAGAPAGAVAGSCVVQGPLDPDAKVRGLGCRAGSVVLASAVGRGLVSRITFCCDRWLAPTCRRLRWSRSVT
jgi:hypothetical protein